MKLIILRRREPFTAGEYFRRDNGSIQTHPYFRGSFDPIGVDDDSEDDEYYSHPESIWTVHEKEYEQDWDQVVCKLILY